ncbi:hypothetical protein [Adhaeribacter terreus]|uniref:Uncharacterized protein n=1 Tax=Adhaeribacter terreus TaxID=529703 RepID=A0ABW0E9V4_9BACT
MAITRLKRKDRKNKARANNKQTVIKQLLRVPVIKNVDPEELKAQFGKPGVVGTVKKAISEVAHKVENAVEAVKEKVEEVIHPTEEKSAE